ncbi:MAG: hypothetical protein ACLQQ4_08950 [Bacteroidia bacterium]
MANKKVHFPVKLDYDDYTYYRVPLGEHSEFNDICNAIKDKVREQKPMPEQVINRFFSLLQNVSKEEYRYYSPFIERAINKVCAHFEKYPKFYFEREYYYWDNKKQMTVDKPKKETKSVIQSWSSGFRDMMEFVIPMLISLDKEESMDERTCMYNAFLLLAFFRNSNLDLYKKHKEQLKPGRLSVISGYITVHVFEFDLLSPTIAKEFITNDHYNQIAKYQAGEVKKKYHQCFGEDPEEFPPLSFIFRRNPL